MRNYSYSVLFFIPFALFLVLAFAEKSFAADPNDFRKPNQWQRERTINDAINKSSVKVEAQKTYPVSTLDQNGKPIKQMRTAKSTIKLGASAANVGKSILKRSPNVAISAALFAILDKTVDWVLDPENNRVKYKDPDGGDFDRFYWVYSDNDTWYKTADAACKAKFENYQNGAYVFHHTVVLSQSLVECWIRDVSNDRIFHPGTMATRYPVPDEGGEIEWQHRPISEIAQKMIQQAEDGQAPAMQVMNDAALDALEAGLLDAQLDAASDIPQPDPEEISQSDYDNSPDPETPPDPDKSCPSGYKQQSDGTCLKTEQTGIELPPFCSWASKVCDFIDWVKTEPPEPPESGEVDVQIPDSNMHEGILERLYINMPAQCPPDPILEFMGAKIPFPMSVFCQFAEMMKPLILLFAYIKGLSIIGNGLT